MERSRLVEANRIRSLALPVMNISIDSAFTSLGGPSFQLYGIAHAEQHLFVVADDHRRLDRLVWVQFEGFLPDNQRTYRYAITETVTLGGVAWIYDASTAVVAPTIAERPDSDFAAAVEHLQTHGYILPNTIHAQRLVYLIEPDKRHEVMIVYGESGEVAEGVHVSTAKERALANVQVQFL